MMNYGPYMMWGGGGWGFWGAIVALGVVAWTVVGVLLAVWLWKQINKK